MSSRRLGRLDFFTMNLRQMAGYGIKAHLIVQSFNDIIEQYGINNTILDNCHILSTFAAADTVTCQRISQMVGTVTEYRESYSEPGRNIGVRNHQSQRACSAASVAGGHSGVAGGRPAHVCDRVQANAREEGAVLQRSDVHKTASASAGPIGVSECPAKPRIEWLHERPKGEQFPLPQIVTNACRSDRPAGEPDDDVDRDVPDDRPACGG